MEDAHEKTGKPVPGAVKLGYVVPAKKKSEVLRRARIDSASRDWHRRVDGIQVELAHLAALLDEAYLMSRAKGAPLWEFGEALGISQQAISKRFTKRLGLGDDEGEA